MVNLVGDDNRFHCPICGELYDGSDYLKTVFQDQRSLWLANMVTHYRHNHISWWNNCWGRYGNSYRGYWFKDYDEEKAKVNEAAKRQIARLSKGFLMRNGIGVIHFTALQGTTEKTIESVRKILEPDIHDLVSKMKNEKVQLRCSNRMMLVQEGFKNSISTKA